MDRVLNAVHDDEWQAFRISMKGKSTQTKLDMLKKYLTDSPDHTDGMCVYCIRVDNYLKALCRGGQLYPGITVHKAVESLWDIRIRR